MLYYTTELLYFPQFPERGLIDTIIYATALLNPQF